MLGVEINFNKIFYKPEQLREVAEILKDLKSLDDDLNKLETDLF